MQTNTKVQWPATVCGMIVAGVLAFAHPAAATHYNENDTFILGADDPPALAGQVSVRRTVRSERTVFAGKPTRRVVSYDTTYKPGTILVSTSERKLRYVLGGGKAIEYAVGVGRPGFQWSGTNKLSRKAEWPTWRPPAAMRAREKRLYGRTLPVVMPGGPTNPLGARALYIGSTLYRIHGTNAVETIGQAVSSGCIRMLNVDVIDLYNRAKVGSTIVVTL